MTAPRVLIFGAVWCGPCKVQKTIMEKLSGVSWEYVDIDEKPEVAAAHGVGGVPTLVFTKSGAKLGRASAEVIQAQLEEEDE